MRPRRGTELHGRGIALLLVGLGALLLLLAVVRLFAGPLDGWRLVTSAVWLLLGAFWTWRGGFMLEWWGPPESRVDSDR